ncbi:GIY-YIG nuclease family protein [Aliarcobacter cryaerophilus]|uniref:GIY-YIG nuclease family protein n=1 Tax=Aliarcobacter cryaerophilus TaxID=28198 RepID=UPI001654312C|nr:GIY-YIG nuclease family protein [Aliarcobacter cryaerophilus]QNM91954.1 hypothetical protein HOO33_08780 [Aliarcobacter cryaerophilus]
MNGYYIYFLLQEDKQRIKIGKSRSIKTRYNTLEKIWGSFNLDESYLIKCSDIKTMDKLEENLQFLFNLHTPEQFGQPADLHPDTLPELIRTASRFIFGQF